MKRTFGFVLFIALMLSFCTSALAGSQTGPRRWRRKIDKNQEVIYKIVFKANEPAEFVFIGDGSTDLDLYVTDAQGKAVRGGFDPKGQPTVDGRDFFVTDVGLIRWVPTQTQTFTIRIRPYTAGSNDVYFGHN